LNIINKKILIVAAHPDDEILGCGGTVARLIKEGCEAHTIILGEGITSRDDLRNREIRNDELLILKESIRKANDIIGIKKLYIYDFPDNRFDTVPLLDIIKVIEKIKCEIKPSIVFTHFQNDLNIDHKITFEAVLTATRPMQEESVSEIYSFEILSSTEWNFSYKFLPDAFWDITDTLEMKINAMKEYKSEIKDFPHPRSIEGIKLNASCWGMRLGHRFIEAFKTIRRIN
jgi:LmbE family N-acetylglucosaminyl deacetylase